MVGHYFLEVLLVFKQPGRQEETHAHSHLAIHRVYFNQNIIMRPLIVPEGKPGELDLLVLPLAAHQHLMIGESVSDGDGVGLEVDVDFTDDGVVAGDFLAVEYAGEGLLGLVKCDDGVVVVEGELLPLTQYRQLLALYFLTQLQYLNPIHLLIQLITYFFTLFIYLLSLSIYFVIVDHIYFRIAYFLFTTN